MGEGRLSGGESSVNHRLTVPEAAAELGITEAAVRGRIKRCTLRSYRESGTVYVLLEGDASSSNRDAPSVNRDVPTDKPTDQSELVAALREQLAAEREANRENRRIIAALVQRVPQLEAPRDEPRVPETTAEEPGGTEPPEDVAGSQEGVERRSSWWRRWFGIE